MKELILTTPTDREIRIVREFDARRTRVFDCYFRPELVKQWMMGPPGWTFAVCDIDLKVGGAYRYVLKGPDGAELAWGGVYREVSVPERVVSVEKYDMDWTGGETLGTIEFAEHGQKTTVTTSLEYSSKEARDGALKSGMAEGMGAGFDRMEALLTEAPTGPSEGRLA